jgi:hypothetical protein
MMNDGLSGDRLPSIDVSAPGPGTAGRKRCARGCARWRRSARALATGDCTLLLRREGVTINHKRVHRLYRAEGLAVQRKRRKRVAQQRGCCWRRPRSSMRTVVDGLHGRQPGRWRTFRTFNLVDDFSREAPAIVVDHSLPGERDHARARRCGRRARRAGDDRDR